MSLHTTKILIVDDSALYRQSLQNVLREVPCASVVGTAKNGVEALAKIEALSPDLLTLDVQMPDMDGIQVLRQLKKQRRAPGVVMVSSLTVEGAQVTTDALMEGAFDFILKPSSGDAQANRQQLHDSLVEKISAFRESRRFLCNAPSDVLSSTVTDETVEGHEPEAKVPVPTKPCELVVLGASTGGPEALKTVLPRLAAVLPVPVLAVQHMPPKYTSSLAQRLDLICSLKVVEAADREVLEPGKVVLAPGGMQMKLTRVGSRTHARVNEDEAENGVRPSVDYVIRSAIEVFGGKVLAVIMTGMGRDGLAGCRSLKQAGGHVFAQSQSDCVVYGMPKAVIEADLADRVLTLGKLAPAIHRHVKRSHREPQGGRL